MKNIALIVEDHVLDREQARLTFEEAGWEVHTASTAREGLALITSWLDPMHAAAARHVVVLLDLILDLHGLHLAAVVCDEQRNGRLTPAPVLIMTGHSSIENTHLARLAGCHSVFTKPLPPELPNQLLTGSPSGQQPCMTPDYWIRSWLIQEGRHLLRSQLEGEATEQVTWTPKDVDVLLKALSGRGWKLKSTETEEIMLRLGGPLHARTYLARLLPAIDPPYCEFLRQLLRGCSVEEAGHALGYGRSHAYNIFRRLCARVCTLMAELKDERVGEPEVLLERAVGAA